MTYEGETVTRRRFSPGGFDLNGDPVTSTSADTAIADVKVAPRTLTQSTERGDEGVIVGWALYCPAGTDILATDRVLVRGLECVIEGEVATWPSGTVVNCKRA